MTQFNLSEGSVRQLTDAAASVTDTYDYDAFGILITRTGTTPNDYLYSGEQFDEHLGFYYLRSRYLSSSSGRFLTSDSFEGTQYDPASLHKYPEMMPSTIGVEDARIGVRRSSVTGVSSKGGEFRWKGAEPTDVDFFIESQTLTRGLKTSQNIPGFVHPNRVMDAHPPLKEWSVLSSDILGRKVTPGAFELGSVPNDKIIEAPW